jgi:hypothetical protein
MQSWGQWASAATGVRSAALERAWRVRPAAARATSRTADHQAADPAGMSGGGEQRRSGADVGANEVQTLRATGR